jgi:hypothetical protein
MNKILKVSELCIPIKNNSLALGIGEHFLELTFRTTK